MIAPRLLRRAGATIVERRGGITPYRCVISEVETRTRTIVLFRDTLELLGKLIETHSLPFDRYGLDDIAIVHECAHLRWPTATEARIHRYVRRILRLRASPVLLGEVLAAGFRSEA